MSIGKGITNVLVTDSEATFTNVPAGITVKLQVTARNAAGETQPAESAPIAVP